MTTLTPLQGTLEAIHAMLGSFDFYVAANTLLFMGVGAGISRSMAVGAMGGYMAFAWLAINANTQFYDNLLLVTLTLILVGFGFKLIRLEALGDG